MTVARERRWRGRRADTALRNERSNGSPKTTPTTPSVTDEQIDAVIPGRRLLRKVTGKDWRLNYRMSVEIGFALSLFLLVALVRAPLTQSTDAFEITLAKQEVVTIEEIQQTKQPEKAPPPPRPPVPVEVADDTVIDDDELELDATLDIGEVTTFLPPPPPEPEEEEETEDELAEIFVVVEEMPEIIGGPGMIYEHLEYPPIARQAQMEGLVIVGLVIEKDGTGSNFSVVKSAGKVLDDAALDAVKKLRYKPGKQRGRAVRVKLAIPIRFVLRDLTR